METEIQGIGKWPEAAIGLNRSELNTKLDPASDEYRHIFAVEASKLTVLGALPY
jgi:hypothetical protein